MALHAAGSGGLGAAFHDRMLKGMVGRPGRIAYAAIGEFLDDPHARERDAIGFQSGDLIVAADVAADRTTVGHNTPPWAGRSFTVVEGGEDADDHIRLHTEMAGKGTVRDDIAGGYGC